MKTKLIFALCISVVCMFFTSCGDDKDNLSVNVDKKVTTTTSQSDDKSKDTTEISAKVTTAVTKNKVEETTAVSETNADSQASQPEKADETVKSDNESASQDTPNDEGQNNNNPVVEETAPTPPSHQASFDESDFKFTYNGHSVVLGENINGFTENVSPDSHISSPSCLGNGEDHVYTYSSFVIYAYKTSDSMIVTGIDLTSGDVATAKNIKINSSVDDLLNAYGDNYSKQGSEYVYSIGDRNIRFKISGEKVDSISYNYDL